MKSVQDEHGTFGFLNSVYISKAFVDQRREEERQLTQKGLRNIFDAGVRRHQEQGVGRIERGQES